MKILADDEITWILGRPNFWCGSLADNLRRQGHDIPRKAEAEQAHVILWMLNLYFEHKENWREIAYRVLRPEDRESASSET